MPRRLTFNLGDDRAPAVTGPRVAYSRRDPDDTQSGECIAVLPTEGGTLDLLLCPPPPTPADTLVSAWLEPAVSPDGGHVAFVWRRSDRNSLAPWSHHLAVAPLDSPAAPHVTVTFGLALSGNRVCHTATQVQWAGAERVRFLCARLLVGRIPEYVPGRMTDTTIVPLALMELDLATETISLVPGGDSVWAWTQATNGTYVVTAAASATVSRLGADGSRTPVGTFPQGVTDFVAVGTRFVGAVGLNRLVWIDPTGGGTGSILLTGIARRLAAADGGRVVVEVERQGDAYGGPANLWLVELPD